MTRDRQAIAAVSDLLLVAGFVPDGQTRQEHVRIPTAKTPVFGHSAVCWRRLAVGNDSSRAGTTIKATVGPRTTALYRIEGAGLGGVCGITTLATKEPIAVRTTVESL